MNDDLSRVLGAIRAQPWAIMPDYLAAIEAIAMRALQSGALQAVAADGHAARLDAGLQAVAAVGVPLQGASMSTVRDGSAVIPVLGPIFPRATMINSSAGGTSLDGIMRDFRVAQSNPDVEQIVMLFDSPGGIVSGLGEAAEAIRASTKPVVAFVTGQCASAAYWLASQATSIVLEPAAQVGSIGVMLSGSRQVAPDANGKRSFDVISTHAPMKLPDPDTEEGRANMQASVDDAEAVFMGDVAKGRKVSVATVRAEFGRGGMVIAKAAVELGMADKIGTLESVLNKARVPGDKKAGGQRAPFSAQVEMRRRAAN